VKLLVIDAGLRLWGSERALLATIPALAEAYEQVVVLAPQEAELVDAVRQYPVTVELAPIGNLHRAGLLARLRAAAHILEVCRRLHIDLIYLNQAGLCRLVHAVARLLALPSVIHVRLADDIERCRRLEATRRAPVSLILVSEDMRRRYPENDLLDPYKQVLTAYDPFELRALTASHATTVRDVACVGRLAALKGQLELIEAVAVSREQGTRIAVDLIGAVAEGDTYANRVAKRSRQLGIDDQIRFLGYRTDAADLMSSYRFIAVPSRYESLGRVVFEAWDAGALPICSSNSGGAAEVVKASSGGLLYDGHAPLAMAETLRVAMAMPEAERQARVEQGRDWARRNLSIDAYRTALAGVLFPEEAPQSPSLVTVAMPKLGTDVAAPH
jgi:glycosyltransferase involved in cell wall biosynthesis